VIDGPYLLDTSTLIWALVGSDRLSTRARKALHGGPLVISVVSYWEVVIKVQKGLLNIADPVNWWTRAIEMLGGDILSIRTPHISALAGLPDIHKDPFDRMLIAQASTEGLAVVTSDALITRYAIKVLW
jgi:PIN domain nuclease of toxin-antitoxin system